FSMDVDEGEVVDDIDEKSPKKDMFPKLVTMLDQPVAKKKKTTSLAKYASLGWGDMMTTRVAAPPQPERDTRAPPEDDHRRRYDDRSGYAPPAPIAPAKPAISNMTPKELHAESCRLMSMQGPKLLQLSNGELQALVIEAIELEIAYQKHFERTNTLIEQVNEMARLEEGKLESLLHEANSFPPSDLPPLGDILVANVRNLLDNRRKARDPSAFIQQPMMLPPEEPVAHVSHPYAAPVLTPSFNPLVPPPGVGGGGPPGAPMMMMMNAPPPSGGGLVFDPSAPPPSLPPPSSTAAPLPTDFSIPPPDFSRPPPPMGGGGAPPPSILAPPSMIIPMNTAIPPPDFSSVPLLPTMNPSLPPPSLPMDMSKPPPRMHNPMVRLTFHDEMGSPGQGDATPPHSHSSTLSAPPPAPHPSLMGAPSNERSGGGGGVVPSPGFDSIHSNAGIQAVVRVLGMSNSPQRGKPMGGGSGQTDRVERGEPQSLLSLRLHPPPGTSPLVGGSPRMDRRERERHDSHSNRHISPSPQKKFIPSHPVVLRREEERAAVPPPRTPPHEEPDEEEEAKTVEAPPVEVTPLVAPPPVPFMMDVMMMDDMPSFQPMVDDGPPMLEPPPPVPVLNPIEETPPTQSPPSDPVVREDEETTADRAPKEEEELPSVE
ncbi:hypothetical protein PFISCL1PPCAC_19294, partial [Pristionchus fissidentatus]